MRRLEPHLQTLVNAGLFAVFLALSATGVLRAHREGRLDLVEISFAAQSAVFLALLLVRRPHKRVEESPWRQAVALAAFSSGALFLGQPQTGSPVARDLSVGIVVAANLLGIATLVNLGRSFGILIALREVKTDGLYAFVRHPMYATDILLRVGYFVGHVGVLTGTLLVASIACYFFRALCEEQFLSQDPKYLEYLNTVRYRFVPGII